MSEKMSDRMSEDMPERMPDRMPEDMPDRMPEDLPDRMPEDMPEDMPEHMPEDMPENMPEDMSNRMPEDLPVRKCINVMVGITRSKVIYIRASNLLLGSASKSKFLQYFNCVIKGHLTDFDIAKTSFYY